MNLLGGNLLVCGEDIEKGFAVELVPMIFARYNFYVSYIMLRCFLPFEIRPENDVIVTDVNPLIRDPYGPSVMVNSCFIK